MSVAVEGDRDARSGTPDGARYGRVAIYLHWAIAALIMWNLASGFLIWDLARGFFKENRAYYAIGITLHLSAGMTVLALTVVRIAWRLIHEPPAHPADMKPWERHASHLAHFFLYAAMLLMPLTGWAILSAHPPAGSAGSIVARAKMAASPMAAAPKNAAAAPGAPAAGPAPAAAPPPPPGIWWLIPLPEIAPISNIGIEPGGVEPLEILHGQFADWHKVGAYLMLLLLLLHVAGALKHQFVDKQPQMRRMGIGRRRSLN